jgi:hypothetical protein
VNPSWETGSRGQRPRSLGSRIANRRVRESTVELLQTRTGSGRPPDTCDSIAIPPIDTNALIISPVAHLSSLERTGIEMQRIINVGGSTGQMLRTSYQCFKVFRSTSRPEKRWSRPRFRQ